MDCLSKRGAIGEIEHCIQVISVCCNDNDFWMFGKDKIKALPTSFLAQIAKPRHVCGSVIRLN